MAERRCEWKYDDIDDFYETSCDEGYCCNGPLNEHKIKFCPFCGGTIEQVDKWRSIKQTT
jgi:hypothetical protein